MTDANERQGIAVCVCFNVLDAMRCSHNSRSILAGVAAAAASCVVRSVSGQEAIWHPAVNTTWQWQLQYRVNTSFDVDMYDVDLFGEIGRERGTSIVAQSLLFASCEIRACAFAVSVQVASSPIPECQYVPAFNL